MTKMVGRARRNRPCPYGCCSMTESDGKAQVKRRVKRKEKREWQREINAS